MPIMVITGGASGIGAACAQLMAKDYKIVIADLKGAEESAASLGNENVGVEIDVSSPKSCLETVQYIREKVGLIDVLVHCAGILNGRGLRLDELSSEMWNQMMAVNLTGTFNVVQSFGAIMKNNGRIVLVSSRAGKTGAQRMDIKQPTGGHYCAAKAAVNSLVKSFAIEFAPRGIRVNGVAPGPVKTPMATAGADNLILPWVPLGRRADPEEIAKGIRFLTSDDSSFITGHMLDINGGMSMN